MKIIKSFEDLGVLIHGITETVKHKIKKTRRRISWNFVNTFIHISTTSNFFSSIRW